MVSLCICPVSQDKVYRPCLEELPEFSLKERVSCHAETRREAWILAVASSYRSQ